ncbi:hypothetical protein [Paenibacillus sp. MER TA 81-3]|nr:hypothetical protein [Paenibacillus sp. MER TA 81-3]
MNKLNANGTRTVEVVKNGQTPQPPQQIMLTARKVEGIAYPANTWRSK